MARKKTVTEAQPGATNPLMDALIAANQKRFNVSGVLSTKKEVEQLVVGIPCPSLAFEYLIMQDVFPLRVAMMLAGRWGCRKTSLIFEFFRWIRMHQGFNAYINTEGKFDPTLAYNIMRATPEDQPFFFHSVDTTEEYQDILVNYQKAIEKNEGYHRVPIALAVDTLAMATSESNQENISKDGHASRGYPVNTLLNKDFFSAYKGFYSTYPVCLLVSNHLKVKQDKYGNEVEYTTGGDAFNYAETFQLHVYKKAEVKCVQYSGNVLELKCKKNSYGPQNNVIHTRVLHTLVDTEDGDVEERAWFDWEWSIIMLLNELINKQEYPMLRKRLKERDIDLTIDSSSLTATATTGYMKILGMTKEDEMPISELGHKLQSNPEVCNLIRDALGIKRRTKLTKSIFEHQQEYVETLE